MSAETALPLADVLARADVWNARQRRRYTITVHHDLRPRRLRPYWATMTHGIFHIGDAYGGIWRARTSEKLIAKCERWIARDMLRNGMSGSADITIRQDASR